MKNIQPAMRLVVDPDPDGRGNVMVAVVIGEVMIALPFNAN